MGKPVAGGADLGVHVAQSFSGTGQSAPVELRGFFNLSLSGFGSATVALERSFDAGATWKTVESFAADLEDTFFEAERGVLYRLRCSQHTAGTIAGRLSQ